MVRPPIENVQSVRLPIDVVTFNAHLLPPLASQLIGKRGDGEYRAGAMAQKLRHYDVVGICEAFNERLADSLIDQFNASDQQTYSFVRSSPPSRLTQLTGGGLLLLSRLPIVEQHGLTFSQGSRFLTTGFKSGDSLAAKGALHARVKIEDQDVSAIDCFLTHLDSYSPSIRANQLQELIGFVQSHCVEGNPLLIMGDFNIVGPVSGNESGDLEYQFLIKRLQLESMVVMDVQHADTKLAQGTSDAVAEDGGMRIDYIFLGWPQTLKGVWQATAKTLPLLDDQLLGMSLSDHAAVECRFEKSVSESKIERE